jgi:Zn ribbon nucleic-acid-binding protein
MPISITSVEKVKEGEYKITSLDCPSCDKSLTITITGEQLFQINQGAFIQDALPEVSADDRERFISGYCPKCWNKMFGL